jgi:hypothetical protein
VVVVVVVVVSQRDGLQASKHTDTYRSFARGFEPGRRAIIVPTLRNEE